MCEGKNGGVTHLTPLIFLKNPVANHPLVNNRSSAMPLYLYRVKAYL